MKIKLWDTKNKEFILPSFENMIILENGTISPYKNDIKMLLCSEISDKNGNLLIEGDVVIDKESMDSNNKPWMGIITKVNGCLSLVYLGFYNDHKNNFPFLIQNSLSDFQTSTYISESCSLVGNSFENPSLLKKEK